VGILGNSGLRSPNAQARRFAKNRKISIRIKVIKQEKKRREKMIRGVPYGTKETGGKKATGPQIGAGI